jgi:hypothetical protein
VHCGDEAAPGTAVGYQDAAERVDRVAATSRGNVREAATGNSASVAFSSCKQTTSGLVSRIQSNKLGSRFLTLLMLNVAIFIFGRELSPGCSAARL